jgi:enterochelin esterase-like enzyme
MLHGLGGHREEWLAYFLIDTLDQEIENNNVPPMIVILPQGDKEYWINHANDGPRWGEYLSRDLVRHIDSTYRTLRSPASRGIGGLSMGGFGALVNAFTHPNVFGVVGAHSTSLFTPQTAPKIMGIGVDFEMSDPITLARTRKELKNLKIWIDIGRDDDVWMNLNILLHNALLLNDIPHIWQVLPGAHDYNYWRGHVLDYVRFYGSALSTQ